MGKVAIADESASRNRSQRTIGVRTVWNGKVSIIMYCANLNGKMSCCTHLSRSKTRVDKHWGSDNIGT
jgi:hypothetical protein